MDAGPSNDTHRPDRPLHVSRDGAALRDASNGAPADLAAVWEGLVDGRFRVADNFTYEGRSYLVLSKVPRATKPPGLSSVLLAALEAALAGGGLRVAAHKLHRPCSTVSQQTKQALSYMGLRCTLMTMPGLVILAAYAALGIHVQRDARFADVNETEGSFRVLSVPCLHLAVAELLSDSELEVLRLLVDGKTRVEVACERHTSAHTVSNQVSSVFRKLGVSRRLDLMRRLAASNAFSASVRVSA